MPVRLLAAAAGAALCLARARTVAGAPRQESPTLAAMQDELQRSIAGLD
jgi:hypothetical protein